MNDVDRFSVTDSRRAERYRSLNGYRCNKVHLRCVIVDSHWLVVVSVCKCVRKASIPLNDPLRRVPFQCIYLWTLWTGVRSCVVLCGVEYSHASEMYGRGCPQSLFCQSPRGSCCAANLCTRKGTSVSLCLTLLFLPFSLSAKPAFFASFSASRTWTFVDFDILTALTRLAAVST